MQYRDSPINSFLSIRHAVVRDVAGEVATQPVFFEVTPELHIILLSSQHGEIFIFLAAILSELNSANNLDDECMRTTLTLYVSKSKNI